MSLYHSRLEVNELDPRIVPSGGPLPVTGSASKAALVQQLVAHALAGTGQGNFLIPPSVYGSGTNYLLHGSANLAGLGKVTISGSIQMPFYRTVAAVTGTLTFTNSSLGTVTVQLQAPAQLGSAPPPHQFSYQVVSATKSLQGVQDSGTLQLVLTIGRTAAGVRTFTYSA